MTRLGQRYVGKKIVEKVMKSRFLFGLLVVLIANLPLAMSAVISQDYVFEAPVITEIDGEHWVAVKDCRPGGIPGTLSPANASLWAPVIRFRRIRLRCR